MIFSPQGLAATAFGQGFCTMSVSISSLLSATLTAGAKSQSQLTLNAISNTLTTRLNNQIAQLTAQSADTTAVQLLQNQLDAANKQNSAFGQASTQWLGNETTLTSLTTQLAALNTAAAAGDSAGFDSALNVAQINVENLNVVPFVSGTQPDGVLNLKLTGLGIQPSATYNLSTPAGQAQAATDVANAKAIVAQITTATLQNQIVASSQSNSLTTEITDLTRRLGEISDNQNNAVATQIANLQQQEQFQFHVIELSLQNTSNASSVITGAATSLAAVLASQPGSRTASTANPYLAALQTSVGIANKLNATRLSGATTQPDGTTTQANGLAQAAAGSLLNLFS
ncbi:MAG TPA: hypothetical protein VET85_14140 [Stellaceae bacterium]|nr:hypothetical protein [Stellaceae bacterium]